MFIARMVFFRLHESPRYLVHAGRHQEAIESLQMISRFNGSELSLNLEDVQDHRDPADAPEGDAPRQTSPPQDTAEVVFDADAPPQQARENNQSPPRLTTQTSREFLRRSPEEGTLDYNSTGEPNVILSDHTYQTPPIPNSPFNGTAVNGNDNASSDNEEADEVKDGRGRDSGLRPSLNSRRSRPQRARSASSLYEMKSKLYWRLPRFIRKPLWAWLERVAMVLSPDWLRTTVLVWGAWCFMSLAYTMFNVYLPKLLEGRGRPGEPPKSLQDNLWDVVIYAIGGCPGAIVRV